MTAHPTTPEAPVHLFLDFSNVSCGARDAAAQHGEDWNAVRLHAANLFRLMAAGRAVASAVMVVNAGVPEAVLTYFRPYFKVVTTESGTRTGLDQAGDEMLQNRLFLLLLQPGHPGVIVVATGDGAGWRRGIGFVPTLIAARRRGFGFEVLAFESQLNPRLRELGDRAGVVVPLDPHYPRITFLEGLRSAQPVFLHHRPTAIPGPWQPGELDSGTGAA